MKLTAEQIKEINDKEPLDFGSLILSEREAQAFVDIKGFDWLKESPHFVSTNLRTYENQGTEDTR